MILNPPTVRFVIDHHPPQFAANAVRCGRKWGVMATILYNRLLILLNENMLAYCALLLTLH